jgi:hypothetical protein
VSAPAQTGAPLSWKGLVPRFSPLQEGGPGRPLPLAIAAGTLAALGVRGVRLIERQGIDGFGPALVFLAAFGGLFLLFWLLIKGALRSTEVTFVLSEKGVEMRPSQAQETIDRRLGVATLIVFLLTFKGTRWASWHPFTPWKSIRRVMVDGRRREILVTGGAWNIRLVCGPETFEPALSWIRARLPPRARIVGLEAEAA